MTDEQKSTEDTAKPPDFAAFLAVLNKGRSNRDLSEKLQQLVEAIDDTGKQGTLTYKITIKPQKTEGMVVVTDAVTANIPRGERPESVAFIGPGFELLRSPANQPTLYDEVTEGNRK